jgi:hypothetical protein
MHRPVVPAMIFMLTACSANHDEIIARTRHAFCNCLKIGGEIQECMASAETGDAARVVTDQQLLLSSCIDGIVASKMR